MAAQTRRVELSAVLRRAAHPPLGDGRFWLIQAMVLLIAGLHIYVDLNPTLESGSFPLGVPVALLIVPVGYAALRYGLSGSATTGLWATLLWLPDLLLPRDLGHVGNDLVDLALIDYVAFFVGRRIEAERLARGLAKRATTERAVVEARYRQLFETNSAPIFVLDPRDVVRTANSAAQALFGGVAIGQTFATLLGGGASSNEFAGRTLHVVNGHDYRVAMATIRHTNDAFRQVVLDDVTEERAEERRATHYAALVVQTEEDQRRRLARELHDEPLQLFLHLARRLESLGQTPGVPPAVTSGLEEARRHSLDAAGRLRTLAQDLRPPALDQLGLIAALSSLLADVEEQSELASELAVSGEKSRLAPEVELGVFRIVQEAVRNAVRHAHAHHLRASLHFASESLTITVVDDGRGFSPDQYKDFVPGHLGLVGMRERARLFDGHLDVVSAPNEGTRIEVLIPLS